MEFKKQSNKKMLLYEDGLPTVPIGYQQTYPQHLWKKVSAGPTEKYCSLHLAVTHGSHPFTCIAALPRSLI